MDITQEKVGLTASWLRTVVWGQAANPASRPVIEAMAGAVERRDWASLGVLAEALGALEALAPASLEGDGGGRVGGVAKRAAEFSRQALGE